MKKLHPMNPHPASGRVRKVLLSISFLLLPAMLLLAQKPVKDYDFLHAHPGVLWPPRTAKPAAAEAPEREWFRHLAVGLGAGTKGFLGAEATAGVVKDLHVRLGFNWLDLDLVNMTSTLGGRIEPEALYNSNIRQTNVELLLDWAFLDGYLRPVAGVAYTFRNQITRDFYLNTDYTVNDLEFTLEETGYVHVVMSYPSPFAPYLGVGLGRAIPKNRVGLAADLGAYYKGTPRVDITGTGIFRSNVENEGAVNRSLREDAFYQFWLVAAVKVTVRLF